MSMNLMQGAVTAALLQNAKLPSNQVLAYAALSAAMPGMLGLALPLAVMARREDPAPANPDEITVPDLKGLFVEKAQEKLKALGLRVATRVAEPSEEDPDLQENQVVSQSPAADEAVNKGDTVALVVMPAKQGGIKGSAD